MNTKIEKLSINEHILESAVLRNDHRSETSVWSKDLDKVFSLVKEFPSRNVFYPGIISQHLMFQKLSFESFKRFEMVLSA